MSANGTWINQDMKLVRGQRRLLHSGDEISLLNPYKHRKTGGWGGGSGIEKSGAEPGRDEDDPEKLEKLEAEAATFTFINLNRWVTGAAQTSGFSFRSSVLCCFGASNLLVVEAC